MFTTWAILSYIPEACLFKTAFLQCIMCCSIEKLVKCSTDCMQLVLRQKQIPCRGFTMACLHPASYMSDSIIIYLNPQYTAVPSSMQPLDTCLRSKDPYEAVLVCNLCLLTKDEICIRIMHILWEWHGSAASLLTYSIGPRIGNYHFIWHVLRCLRYIFRQLRLRMTR